jgi:UDP-4-amino-4,6-dideoxy-N-acetyl-beta-L-altrosamine transaminase
MTAIPYGRQWIDEEDIAAVVAALRSDWLTQGPLVAQFEKAVAEYCGAKYAVAVANGTAALHIAAAALNLGKGDLLWTTPNTFVASANCGRYCGADVDFVDIDPRTYNMSAARLEEKLDVAAKSGKLPKVVVPVHFSGQPCEMEAIGVLAKRFGFRVIEDAAHALGGSYLGKRVGSGEFSDLTTMSFHPVKIVTTAEGGMVLTNSTALHEKLAVLRTHGITRDPKLMSKAPDGPWYYEQVDLGWNYRLTDVQCALGVSQMRRLDDFVARRRAIAKRYDELLQGLRLTLPHQDARSESGWHLYVVRVHRERRAEVFAKLREEQIFTQIHYIPVHLQPYYRALGFRPGMYPEAELYYEEALSLPMFPALTDAEQDRVAETLRQVLKP